VEELKEEYFKICTKLQKQIDNQTSSIQKELRSLTEAIKELDEVNNLVKSKLFKFKPEDNNLAHEQKQ